MKKYLAAIATAAFAMSAVAAPVEITVHDGLSHSERGPGYVAGSEDQSLNFGSTWGQEWDLEALFFDNTTLELSMVSGFDVFNKHPENVTLGDIFIKTEGSSDWSYAITFNRANGIFTNNEYSIVDLTVGSYDFVPLQGNYDVRKADAKPYAIANYAANNVISTGAFSYGSYSDMGGTHFTMGDLSLASIVNTGESFFVHQTMSCGNDVIHGNVPEPALISLIGLSMISVALIKRKKR